MNISCSPALLSLYGPLTINVYGFFIALGILICMILTPLNTRYKKLHLEKKFTNIIVVSILAGIIGGRVLAIISQPTLYNNWSEWCSLCSGGFSAFGSILGVIFATPLYLKYLRLPVLPVFDLFAIYAPLFQSIARLGCLFAGCCHGSTTESIYAVTYTNPTTIALYNTPVHPTQLYSSFLLLIIFLVLFFFVQHRAHRPGIIFLVYVILAAAERFIIDFWRADRIILSQSFLSFHQLIAIGITACAIILYGIIRVSNR